jgi:hypothetical protein
MKFSIVFASIALAGFCSAINAAVPNKIAVFSTEQSNGSISIGEKSSYTKTLEVTINNLSNKDVDLSSLCLNILGPDNKQFKLDTVDEILVKGTLKSGKAVKGMALFSSEDSSIYKETLIKISDDCK